MGVNHYENFPVASVLLPARLRYPVTLIYRFARAADDFADEGDAPPGDRLAALAAFGEELRRIERGQSPDNELFRELAPVMREYSLPLDLFHDLLSAFAQDVTQKRYADFSAVLDYSRRSANPVGRLLLALYRAATPQHLQWSDDICSSLQIINFLQDIAIDYAIGPHLHAAGRARALWHRGTADRCARDQWPSGRAFMRFQIERARAMLWSGAPLGRSLRGRIGLEMRMIIAGGDRVLTKILANDCDIFRRRPVLRSHDWMVMLARTFSM
jgi:squalene synthase HpnC